MKKRAQLVCQHLENISRQALEQAAEMQIKALEKMLKTGMQSADYADTGG